MTGGQSYGLEIAGSCPASLLRATGEVLRPEEVERLLDKQLEKKVESGETIEELKAGSVPGAR
ncbi:MAG: hypothetical protein PHP59_00630 [Methanofollis sp.]|uniref:hypothetical protein n=1 Tax=Methanofollis sp. TaxID=2052835 RepID=UPI002614683E|nr:hypothetical protein [Methanofollis sp.]MDD4253868.1 hypothetical protein [Methanofollis sp.]